MSNEFALGFVAVFASPLDDAAVRGWVGSWLDRFEKVEQLLGRSDATITLMAPGDLVVEEHLTFRVLNGDQFAWVYVSLGARVAETSGLPNGDQASLSLEVLMDLDGLENVVPDHDEKQLELLEAQGLL
jgi:hypothetical protein